MFQQDEQLMVEGAASVGLAAILSSKVKRNRLVVYCMGGTIGVYLGTTLQAL